MSELLPFLLSCLSRFDGLVYSRPRQITIYSFEFSGLSSTTHITIPWLPCGRACVAGGEDGMEFSNVRIAAVLTDLHMMMLHIAPSVVR